jgi:hypothetical protein
MNTNTQSRWRIFSKFARAFFAMVTGVCLWTNTSSVALAAEGGSGEYVPGFFGFMAGYIPPESGFYFANDVYLYTAEASRVAANGITAPNVEADIAIDLLALTWISPWKIFEANYGMGIAQGFGYVNIDVGIPALGLDASPDTFGLSDTVFTPALLGWHKGELHWSLLFNVYAPTGQYESDQAVNLSKNFWAIEPMVNVTYLHMKTGTELSGAFGYTVNFENSKTNYDSGDVFHFDWALGQYLNKQFKIGVVGYVWVQVTGDSGSGATLGDFESEVYGVGPAIDYVAKIGQTDVDFQLKWYHEFESKNRLEGDALYAIFAFKI